MTTLGNRSSTGRYTRSVEDPQSVRAPNENDFVVNSFRLDEYLSNIAPFLLKLPSWLGKDRAVVQQFTNTFWGTLLKEHSEMRERVRVGTALECFQTNFLANQEEYGLYDLEALGVFFAFMDAGTSSPHNVMLSFTICMLQDPEWLKMLE
ncbi:hypothetical protein BDY17DRAFT_320732 [Neohortaea acidophila]|uniref:Cytochrome P450 n=1 Tax=Neohortaea acidophila TaxID=245834 RepID=A0A6A6Q8B4_9PEZI|nr:uncharacterized protein BDY17DRAFT_320732 [Neohortaea acidophila]KAF2488244.1 hypothetical protein BDY17DRAFT_320732 [Neohortaea acidophila]